MSTGVLVVDDEALFATSVSRRLTQAGYLCATAGTLAEARAELARNASRLVLLDVRLPDGSGLDFLDEIEMQGRLLHLDVIVLTAYAEISDAVEAVKRGAADYLTKPVDLNTLTLAVDRVLTEQRLRHQHGLVAGPRGNGTTLAQAEKRLLEAALIEAGGNVSEAARRLGISRMTMRYRMAKHTLDR